MVIKSSKDYKFITIISLCLLLPIIAIFYYEATSVNGWNPDRFELKVLTYIVFVMVLICVLIITKFYMVFCRTIIMDAEGVTIEILWMNRSYKWDELKTKRIEYYDECLGVERDYYKEGVVFSTNRIGDFKKFKPSLFSLFLPTLSNFFVYFDPKIKFGKWDMVLPDVYMVDKEDFMNKMKEWNVSLTEIKKGCF